MKTNSGSLNGGFALVELLLYSAIFVVVALMLTTILVSMIKIESRQTADAEISHQSQFLLQTIQRAIERSSLVDMIADSPTSTLKLRMASSSAEPTYIYLDDGVVYLKETDSGTAQPLTSARVVIDDLNFIKRSNVPGHDSVSVNFTMVYNSNNPQQRLSRILKSAVTRVTAATFDSNILPATDNNLDIGVSGQGWRSINGRLYFSGSNIGIGAANPGQTLEINGGLRLNTTAGQPTCDATQRGTFWVTQSGAGVKDNFEVCAKDATDVYAWRPLD